jgi:preprotein translocase subunit YajC
MTFFPFLFGAAEGGAAGGAGGGLMTILPFGLIILIFYFFIIRPQNKKQKETQKMISAVKKGDKVITIGGIHGLVSSTDEQTVVVKVDDDTKIKFNRSAIGSVVQTTSADEEKEEKKSRGRKKIKGDTTGAE